MKTVQPVVSMPTVVKTTVTPTIPQNIISSTRDDDSDEDLAGWSK
jgi:hypothetical protein